MSQPGLRKLEIEITKISADIEHIKKSFAECIPEIRKNTEFRYKAWGMITGVGAVFSVLVNVVIYGMKWFINK